jgi:MoaA/NifB/PqqE/SkfB family radical SAM enzyme
MNSRFGKPLLNVLARLLYLKPVRKQFIAVMDRLLQESKFRDGSIRTGSYKIQEQYRWISRAALHSLDRAIEKRVLAPQVAQMILYLWVGMLFPSKQRKNAVEQFRQNHGSAPPWFLVISPTHACNLKCTGCYANSGSGTGNPNESSLTWETLDRMMTEAKESWGMRLFVFSGGEPLTYRSQGKDLLDLVEKHQDCLFLMFTNGTLITNETANRLARLGNLTPSLSVEGLDEDTDQRRGAGVFNRVLDSMALLRQAGVPFGISITVTSSNCEQVLSDPLLDFYFEEQGAFYAFIFPYMPMGRYPDLDWMPKPDQRIPFWRQSWDVVRQRRLFLLDFWNHGPMVEGCIAAGRDRGYLHIDWNGNVMPCVFMPYVAVNLQEIYDRGGTLDDVWVMPFFRAVRQWQRDYGYDNQELTKEGNWMLPCPFRDHFATLRTWVQSLDLKPQEGVAPEMLLDEVFCEKMLAYGAEQARLVQPLWEQEYL